MRRFLKIELLQSGWDHYIRIMEQTNRGIEFSDNGVGTFEASNGFVLASIGRPAVGANGLILFVRGGDRNFDDVMLKVPLGATWLLRLKHAVREYNRIGALPDVSPKPPEVVEVFE